MKIGIIGGAGRMGSVLIRKILTNPAYVLAGSCERSGSDFIGTDLGKLVGMDNCGIDLTDDPASLIEDSDGIIDFTAPETSLQIAKLAAQYKKIHVIGTTGFSEAQHLQLTEYAASTPIIWSSNMSIAVALLNNMVEHMASILGDDYDIEILEMHHRYKKDAPSGTAITLGESAARGRNVKLQDVACYSRHGIIGERKQNEIGFATLRGGSVIGDHSVIFASDEDRLEITHKSSSRDIYAKGALRACLWAQTKAPGLYSIQDVLSFD